MTSETAKYMQMLRRYLRKLPDDEIDDIVEFYSEYLADAGIDTKAEIEQELGTPRQLALKILADHSIKEEAENQRVVSKTKIKTTWLIILALLATPATLIIGLILLSVLIAIFAVVFSGVVVVISLAGGWHLPNGGGYFYRSESFVYQPGDRTFLPRDWLARIRTVADRDSTRLGLFCLDR